jgi:uncharacterized protein (DUF2147 family)
MMVGNSGIRQWTRLLGNTSTENSYGVATDRDNNVYITGYSLSPFLDGIMHLGSSGIPDAFLAKYNSSGYRQWIRVLANSSEDSSLGVATDSDNNVYIIGFTLSPVLDGIKNAGNYDAFLAKYSSSGDRQWTRLLGNSSEEVGQGIAIDGDNNIYITGYTSSLFLDGEKNAGNSDAFLAKYNSSGGRQWTRLLGNSSTESGRGVATDGDNNVYITGTTSSAFLDGNANAGGIDAFLAKYSSNGDRQWTRQLGNSSSDYSLGVATDGDNNVYITGYTFSAFLDGNTNTVAGGEEVLLVKYSSSGDKQWTRLLGNLSTEYGFGVATDGDNNVYITGQTNSGSLDGNTNAAGGSGTFDAFLAKYSSSGNKQWTRLLGNTSDETGRAVATAGDNSVYITGYTSSQSLNGNAWAGSYDAYLTKFS